MALYDPPEMRHVAEFMAGLPNCAHGCDNQSVYLTPTFRTPTADDTIDAQVAEIIAQYEREADGQMQRHLAQDHWDVSAFLGVIDEFSREARQREAAYRAWVAEARPVIAEQLTAALPADMRAAGIRFEWEAQR